MMMDFALQAVTRIINEGAYCNIAVNEVLQKPFPNHEKAFYAYCPRLSKKNTNRLLFGAFD